MLSLTSLDIHLSKKEKYAQLLVQIKSLIEDEKNLIANLANVSSVLKENLSFDWIGFYLFDGEELVLGPFQGSLACSRIKIGNGVCGKAFQKKKTIIVEDVNQFEGHIACSIKTQSEIVVPIILNDNAVAVLDADSNKLNSFDETDANGLIAIANSLSTLF